MLEQDGTAANDGRHTALEQFSHVKALYRGGRTASSIVKETGLSRKRVDRWIRLHTLPERKKMAPTTASPSPYHSYLSERWAVGVKQIRWLLDEIRQLGYTGCRSRLADYISPWRIRNAVSHCSVNDRPMLPIDPTTNVKISALVAARVCMKPRSMLSQQQLLMLDVLKDTMPGFRLMRRLSLQFRALLRSHTPERLSR
jgi:hypothetical protein